jgi:hypothetical protein
MVSGNVVSWTAIPNATKYKVQIYKADGTTTVGSVIDNGTSLSIDLSAQSPALATGTYTVKVQAVGDGTTYLDSDWSGASAPAVAITEKLATPSPTVDGNTITWPAVDNATKYMVKILDSSQNEITTQDAGTALTFDLTAYPSAYTIQVMAVGDGTTYLDSDWSAATSPYANAAITGTVFSSTDGLVSDVTVSVGNPQGTLLQSATTGTDGKYTMANLPAGATTVYITNKSGKVLVSAAVTLVNGQTVVQNLKFPEVSTITLSATPSQLVGDGKSTSALSATMVAKGTTTPIPGVPVVFTTTAGTLSSGSASDAATTNASGIAASTLTAPVLSGIDSLTKTAQIVVRDLESGIFAEKTVDITFLPASIRGVVTVGGKPVAGATVTIEEDLGPPIGLYKITVTTGPDGSYNLIVPLGNREYTLHITAPVVVDGKTIITSFDQKANVGSAGKGETVTAISQISGQLFVKNNLDKAMSSLFKSSNPVVGKIYDSTGKQLTNPVTVDSEGRFSASGLSPGTYKMLFQMTVNGETLAGVWVIVTISENGEIAIAPVLIDPYGIVSDSMTKAGIPGVDMQLFWADTALNRSKGRTPDTLVGLPGLPEFAPNMNANPQITTATGEYAWMVFANGDYYIKAAKTGYDVYDSRVEKRNVPVAAGEDSYIQDGIIHVGETIVRYDLTLSAQQAPAGSITLTAPLITETTVNLAWNTVTGAVYYNLFMDGAIRGTVTGATYGTVTSVTYSVYGLNPGSQHTFYIIGGNGAGQSALSNVLPVTTATPATPPAPPAALSVSVSGKLEVGSILTGNYTYKDANGDAEGPTRFQWYRANDSSGSGRIPIPGTNGKSYTLTRDDAGKYISFEVTPVSSAGGAANTGSPMASAFVGPITQTDAQVNQDIKDALKNLKVGFSKTDIWESITLPVFLVKDGDYGTLVGWSSSNDSVMKISEDTTSSVEGNFEPNKRKFVANVTRQPEDESIILTATVMKGNGTPLQRTFLMIVKSTKIAEEKVTVPRSDSTIVVDGQQVAADITRTTLSNNKQIDKLTVGEAAMTQLLQTNKQQDVLNLHFNDKPNNDTTQRADEMAVEIPIRAIEKIGTTQSLQVTTPDATVGLSPSSLAAVKDQGLDLYIRIVPVREDSAKQQINNKSRIDISTIGAKGNITFLDIPREIETNYINIDTVITLPLGNIALPTDPTQQTAFLNSLRVFIQHSNGTKEIVGGEGNTPGTVVYENGAPSGFQFHVSHFSTFVLYQDVLPQPAAPGVSVAVPYVPAVTGTTANLSNNSVVVDLNGTIGYFDENALQVTVGGMIVKVEKVTADGDKLTIVLADPIPAGSQVVVKYDPALAQYKNMSPALPALNLTLNNAAIHEKYMNGYPDGEFKPDNSITRAEMAAILARLLGKGSLELPVESYPDVTADHWAGSSIELMKLEGLMTGYDDGEFKPEQFITRAEFAATVLRFMNHQRIVRHLDVNQAAKMFVDIADHWAEGEIAKVREMGVMEGEGNLFYPDRNLSRAEAVTTLNRVLDRGPLTGDFTPSWPDVTATHWSFGHVEEASRTHESSRISHSAEQLIRFRD